MTYQLKKKGACKLCGSAVVARMLCRSHYQKAWKSGDLQNHKLLGPNDVFESRIQKTDGCWIWTGTKHSYGYGVFLLPGEKAVRAHRYSYEYFVGKIPEGKIILHICDNPICVRPDHLRVGTKDDNNKDTAIKRRHNYGLDHWNGRLSDSDISDIRNSTESTVALALRYKCDQSHISRIKRFLVRT